ncbi:transcription factor bHLH52 [Prunus persica]|uniref:transcription factor bHLH52 n=1 Tax=Prunus persica TaxID=3760 RepID=UPI0009AB3883|nr:transcription factor bHLH52 [Prunus persica]
MVPPQSFGSVMTNFFQPNIEAELLAAEELLKYYQLDYNRSILPNNLFLDDHPCHDPYNLVNLENYHLDTTSDDHLFLPHLTTPDMFPQLDFYSHPYPKRQKCFQDFVYPEFTPATFYDAFPPDSCPLPELLPAPGVFATPLLTFNQHLEETVTDSNKSKVNDYEIGFTAKKKVEEKCVSAQSIAARERRRKITEKTQELGKLVPGGSKMNTAEMLTAAYNFVKYLRAQVGILEFMGSFQGFYANPLLLYMQELKGAPPAEELQVVAFPIIQEKLYLKNNCLVPEKFVEILAKHFDAQSKPSLSNNLHQLLTSSG